MGQIGADGRPRGVRWGSPEDRAALQRQPVVAVRADDDDLAWGVVEEPGDVVAVESLGAAARRRDDEAVVARVRDRLPHGVADRPAALDPRVHGYSEPERPLLDYLQ